MSDIIKTQQGLARKAEVNRTHHFEDLYHLLCKREWIEEALQHVLDNDGAGTAGVDGVSWKSFNDVDKSDFENEKFRQHFIETLQEELKRHTFKPMPVRRVEIPKPGTNKKRGLGIPTLKDYDGTRKLVLRHLSCWFVIWSGSHQDALSQKMETSSTIHRSLHKFELVDLPLNRTVAVRKS